MRGQLAEAAGPRGQQLRSSCPAPCRCASAMNQFTDSTLRGTALPLLLVALLQQACQAAACKLPTKLRFSRHRRERQLQQAVDHQAEHMLPHINLDTRQKVS